MIEIHLHEGRRHAGNGRYHALEAGQPQRHRQQGNAQNADDDGAAHTEIVQHHDDEKAQQRQEHRPIRRIHARLPLHRQAEFAHVHQRGLIAHHHARAFERNQRQKQADAGGNRHFQAHRQRVHQHFAHFQKAEQNKDDAGNKHRRQRHLPRHAHAFDHAEGEIGIQPHAGRQRNRIVGQRAHNQAADGGGNASGHKYRTKIHPRLRQGVRIHHDDVAHGEDGGQPRHQLGADGGLVFGKFEITA